MGQRHQVYAITGRPGEAPTVIGLHHQWLYGRMALHLLGNLLTYHIQAKDQSAFSNDYGASAQDVLNAIYSVDYAIGYAHMVHVLKEETKDPLKGDNNDGITIIDFRGERPKYCFLKLPGQGDSSIRKLKPGTPYNAAMYVRCYYYKGCYFYKDRPKEVIEEIEKELEGLVEFLSPFEVMTAEEVYGVFPTLEPGKKAKATA